MADAATTTIATKDIVTWCVTGVGLLVTLGWNLQNRRRTDRIATDLRGEAFRLDEWKGKRSAIATRLADFESAAASIAALTRGAHDAAGLREELTKQNQLLITAHEALLRVLQRTDRNWEALAFGRTQGTESDWDQLNTILADTAEIESDATAMRSKLAAAQPFVTSIAELILEHVNATTASFDPVKW